MKIIMIALVVATFVVGCSKKEEEPGTIPVVVNLDAGSTRDIRPRCPDPEPCPECPVPDAIFYTVLTRVIRGEVESFLTRGLVHHDGAWHETAKLGTDGPVVVGLGAEVEFVLGDRMLAQVEREPRGLGTPVFDGEEYEQYGPLIIDDSSAPIQGVRGGVAHMITVFSAAR